MIDSFKNLDDLQLHDIVFEILDETRLEVKESEIEALIAEAAKRQDIVLVTAAVELSEQVRTKGTLDSLRKIAARKDSSRNLDILLLDEFASRIPDTTFNDFFPYLNIEKIAEVRRFCARLLFSNDFDYPINQMHDQAMIEADPVVKAYLLGLLFSDTTNIKYLSLLNKLKKTNNLDAVRAATEIINSTGF